MSTYQGVDDRLFTQSSLREEYLEYCFLADLSRVMWQRRQPMEILRTNTDQGGYDLVLEVGRWMRHVQLKSSHRSSSTSQQKINTNLADKQGACVVWIRFDQLDLSFENFLWFGDTDPRRGLPDLGERIGKHTKTTKTTGEKGLRKSIRVLRKGEFTSLASIADVAENMFPKALLGT